MGRTVEVIKIEGLRDFQAALKRMDGATQKKLRLVLNEAAEIVVVPAKARAARDTRRGAASIRALSSQREARVVGGGARVPFYGFMDFGGSTGRGHIPRKAGSGSVKRPFLAKRGRYIFRSYFNHRVAVRRAVETGLVRLATEAGLKVERGGE